MAASAQSVKKHATLTEQGVPQNPAQVSQKTAPKVVPEKRPLEEESAKPPPKRKRNPSKATKAAKQDVSVKEDGATESTPNNNPGLRPDGTDLQYDSSRLVSWAFNISYMQPKKPRDLKFIQDEVFQVRDFQIAVKHMERSIDVQETRAMELKEELVELGGMTLKKAVGKKVSVSDISLVNVPIAYHHSGISETFQQQDDGRA